MSLSPRRGQSSALRTTTMTPGRTIAPAGEDDDEDEDDDEGVDEDNDAYDGIDGMILTVRMMILFLADSYSACKVLVSQ